jgi:sugar/nucleoside kinase (ribokinase family)
MFDLISIGDVVIDTFVPLEEGEVVSRKGEKRLMLRYGTKISVGSSTSMLGGNAANNAVGASRLKLKTAIYTNVGEDDDNEKIKKQLKRESVDTRYVVENRDMTSNHHIVLDFMGEKTILVQHQPWKYQLPDLDRSKWIYLTSMATSFTQSNVIEQLINHIERTRTKLVYNPGTFQIKAGIKKYARLLSLVELLIINKEEAKLVLGHQMGDEVSMKRLLSGIRDLGPKNVIITDGREGAYGYDGETMYYLGLFPAKLKEMTGAGDAYATGTLAGLYYGNTLPEAMRWGAANSASVVEQIGPQAGLLTFHQMEQKLKENPKITAQPL